MKKNMKRKRFYTITKLGKSVEIVGSVDNLERAKRIARRVAEKAEKEEVFDGVFIDKILLNEYDGKYRVDRSWELDVYTGYQPWALE